MKYLWLFVLLMVAGCDALDTSPVEVKIISVKTLAQYENSDSWHATFPHTVVERTDNHMRAWLRHDTWGKTGDVFKVQVRQLMHPEWK